MLHSVRPRPPRFIQWLSYSWTPRRQHLGHARWLLARGRCGSI